MDGVSQARRTRRTHSAAFKAKVLQACNQPGVSIAAVALAHELNANLVRRWMNGRDLGVAVCASAPVAVAPNVATAAAAASASALPVQPRFLAVQLAQQPAPDPDIRLELHRAGATVSVIWPAHAAAACGAWLREWLR
jgi:transposase